MSPELLDDVRWHALTGEDVLERLETTTDGLASDEVPKRQERFGRNLLPAPEPPGVLEILLHQFKSPLIYILLVAGAVALLVGEGVDAAFIMAVLVLNAGIGTWQEWKAEKSAAGLQKLLVVQARVLRDGREETLSAEELVPGDVVSLESGNRVPADLRILQARNLRVDESLLTGESLATEKFSSPVDEGTGVSDQASMAFAGSTVSTGRSLGVVVATGLGTEVGRISRSVTESASGKPPLLIRMERFAHQIAYFVVGASIVLGLIAAWQGMPWIQVFFLAVALAVSAIPEGLPVALTVALSVATSRMAKRKVIVRKLTAVESLGSCQIIASDKTGTLTVNQQTVTLVQASGGERFTVSGGGYRGEGVVERGDGGSPGEEARALLEELGRASILCNEASLSRNGGSGIGGSESGGSGIGGSESGGSQSGGGERGGPVSDESQGSEDWRHSGDAMDVALLAFGYKLELDPEQVRNEHPTLGEIPFESERRYAATFYRDNGKVGVAVKGAVERVLPLCREMRTIGGAEPVDQERLEADSIKVAEEGYRVLAVASGTLESGLVSKDPTEDDLPPLTLLGLVGFIDPLRPEAKDAVAACRKAGLEVMMITGDHPATAAAISRDLGIADEDSDIITGDELEGWGETDDPSYIEAIRSHHVFARVSPLQKLHIVEGLVNGGVFVAVTGDGVNDAPALRRAHIGVAMGSGTDVAKDTAEMIVADDSFASIVAGVEEGRHAFANVRKVIYLLISTGAAEVLLFLLALLTRMPLPLFAVQILWLNLVTNGIQDVALAFEGGEPGAMKRPPRKPAEGIFNRLMVEQTIVSGLVMGILAFGSWRWMLGNGWEEETARNSVLMLMVLLQNIHVFNCRSEYESAFRVPLRRNVVLVLGVLAAHGIHILALHLPLLQVVLRTEPISLAQWGVLFLLALPLLVVMEIYKWVRARPMDRKVASGGSSRDSGGGS
jgi:magnesium-transporting ATPase (P-type)